MAIRKDASAIWSKPMSWTGMSAGKQLPRSTDMRAEKAATLSKIELAAQAAGAQALRPGARASEVDSAARQVNEEAGFGEHFRHRLGHAIGKDVHEAPYLDVVDDTPLAAGMTFTIEPSVFITGEFGTRVEDVFVVTDAGGVRLNRADANLVVV
jgi:Xaa-Pro aminopeptidase